MAAGNGAPGAAEDPFPAPGRKLRPASAATEGPSSVPCTLSARASGRGLFLAFTTGDIGTDAHEP